MDISDLFIPKPRRLPVILILDTSGSMIVDGKIEQLNKSIKELITSGFGTREHIADVVKLEIMIIVIGGSHATVHKELMPVENIIWNDMPACGATPAGEALKIAKEIIENKSIIDSRAYRPFVLLALDGMPSDEYEEQLERFCNEGRSSKCTRIALCMGNKDDIKLHDLLNSFKNTDDILEANSSNEIKKCFEEFKKNFLTWSPNIKSEAENMAGNDELVF